MKLKFLSFVGFLVTLTLCSVSGVMAQEGTPSNEIQDLDYHPELNLNEDKTLIYEPEKPASSTSNEKATQTKEQIVPANNSGNSSKSVEAKSSEHNSKSSPAKNQEEDALSFNFLYYIIQKFKISDIVEQ